MKKYWLASGLGLSLCLLTAQAQTTTPKKAPPAAQPTTIEQRTGHGAAPSRETTEARLPPGVTLTDGLSADEAVAIALWNNAQLHADLAVLGLARADLIDAGLLRNPLLQVVLPIGPYHQFESLLNFPFEVLWQRKRRVVAATAEVNRVAQGLEQNALELMRDVRLAYAEWRFAEERARLTNAAADVRTQFVKLTEVRVRYGEAGEVEATSARLEQSLADEQAARAQREIIPRRERLRHLMGVGQTQLELKLPTIAPTIPATYRPTNEAAPVEQNADTELPAVWQAAFAARPDLRAAGLAIEAAAARAKWEHSRVATLAGLLNLKQGEGVPFAPRPGFVAELPVFNRNQGGKARADAEVERAAWQYLAVKQRIAQETQEAFDQQTQARAALQQWRAQVVPQAETNAQLAERVFAKGDQSYLFVLDAVRRLVDVRLRELELWSDTQRAAIQLDRAVGRKLDANP